jgi:HEAT repeat protein
MFQITDALVSIGVDSITPLVGILHNKDAKVRHVAATALDKLQWQPTNTEDQISYWIAQQNWEKCVEFDLLAIAPLINVLEDSDPVVQAAVVETLKRIGDSRAITPLRDLLESGSITSDRIFQIMDAFVTIGVDSITPLVGMLHHKDIEMRHAAAVALDKLHWQPTNTEDQISYWIAQQNWEKCVETGSEAVELLIRMIDDSNGKVQESVIETLAHISPPPVEILIHTFRHSSISIQSKIARTLEQIGTPATIHLITMLNDERSDLRKAGIEMLEKINDVKAVEALIGALADQNRDVRRAATKALGAIGDMRALDSLIHILDDPHEDIRETAIVALGKLMP